MASFTIIKNKGGFNMLAKRVGEVSFSFDCPHCHEIQDVMLTTEQWDFCFWIDNHDTTFDIGTGAALVSVKCPGCNRFVDVDLGDRI